MQHFDSLRPEFAPYGFTCEVWEPVRMPRPDRHDEIEINYLDQGSLTYLIGGDRVRVEARTLVCFWAAAPHQIVECDGVTFYYVITIPFGWFLQWGLPSTLQKRLILGNVVSDVVPDGGVDDSALMGRWQSDLSSKQPELREIVLLELKARLWRLSRSLSHHRKGAVASGADGSEEPRLPASNISKAEQMASYIARHYRERIRIPDIAENVGLHPDYASTLFKKTFGTTLNALITKHRISDAQRRLISTDDLIIDVAHAAGFDSISRFNSAFKESAGMTPRQYRKSYPPAAPREPADPSAGGGDPPGDIS